MLSAISIGLVILAAFWVLDRLLVRAELRGWITYRLTPRPTRSFRGSAGDAMLGLGVFFNPGGRHVQEMKQEAELHREADDEAGADRSGRGIAMPCCQRPTLMP
jgi:hypothetical protein